MSSVLPQKRQYPFPESSDENQSEENENLAPHSESTTAVTNNAGSLFDMLSPELLLLVFEWIGPNDMKSYVRLASCHDPFLTSFIYHECTHLWKQIDLANFPGITDNQLQSLLERVSARSITASLLLDKNASSPITGSGLEPLRHSRVLERVDLRQSNEDTRYFGRSSLNDDLVVDILLTCVPYKLEVVKAEKQNLPRGSPFDEYCSTTWQPFLIHLRSNQALKIWHESCSHCDAPLVPPNKNVLKVSNTSAQCTVCKKYSCRTWNQDSQCAPIVECKLCLEWCCSCRQTFKCDSCNEFHCSQCEPAQLSCQECSNSSCSKCKDVQQCSQCRDVYCSSHGPRMNTCDRCKETYCEMCCSSFMDCRQCNETVCCGDLIPVHFDWIRGELWNVCSEKCRIRYVLANCQDCHSKLTCSFRGNEISVYKCSVCGLASCCNPSFPDNHECIPPGDSVYVAEDANNSDEVTFCACRKGHLTSTSRSAKQQTFMCSWINN